MKGNNIKINKFSKKFLFPKYPYLLTQISYSKVLSVILFLYKLIVFLSSPSKHYKSIKNLKEIDSKLNINQLI